MLTAEELNRTVGVHMQVWYGFLVRFGSVRFSSVRFIVKRANSQISARPKQQSEQGCDGLLRLHKAKNPISPLSRSPDVFDSGVDKTRWQSEHSWSMEVLKRYEEFGTIARRAGSRCPTKITPEMEAIVERQMSLDDETTAVQLRRILADEGHPLSLRTILRSRKKLE